MKDGKHLTLGIETSCDETAASVVADGRLVMSNIISSQIDIHTLFGGVVPEIASRQHIEAIDGVIMQALTDAKVIFEELDAIAVTEGPGLVGALLVGVSEAKGLAYSLNKPLLGTHHLKGHIAANYITDPAWEPPFLCLVVSGGHTDLILIEDYNDYRILGRTRDDAAGEAFDKVARAIGLGYPGGPKIQKAAELLSDYDVKAYALDVSDIEAIPGVIEQIRSDLGEIRFLIQAAGIMAGGAGIDLEPAEWDRVMNTNAKGLFFVMQQCVKQSMLPQKFGAIVNIASMAGIRGMTPPMCSAHYSASKGAVVSVTMQAAVEWAANNIRANVIAPGGVMSGGAGVHLPQEGKPGPGGPGGPEGPGGPGGPMGPTTGVPTGRLSDPEEIAGMALYLCSEWSENTTGQVIVIDGGSTAVGY